jgi:NADP-dependent 3-hydroxy acid dehydrogenase YdfG
MFPTNQRCSKRFTKGTVPQQGAHVLLTRRSEDELQEVAAIARKCGASAIAHVADASDTDAMQRLFVVAGDRGLDVVFANAGTNGT